MREGPVIHRARVNPNRDSLENSPEGIVMQILHRFDGSIQQYMETISDPTHIVRTTARNAGLKNL
jgi:hypothetical protein